MRHTYNCLTKDYDKLRNKEYFVTIKLLDNSRYFGENVDHSENTIYHEQFHESI